MKARELWTYNDAGEQLTVAYCGGVLPIFAWHNGRSGTCFEACPEPCKPNMPVRVTQTVSWAEQQPARKLRPLRELRLALETPEAKGNKRKNVIFLGPFHDGCGAADVGKTAGTDGERADGVEW